MTMYSPPWLTPQKTFVITVLLFALLVYVLLTSFFSGFAGISPEYKDKQLVYVLPYPMIEAIFNISRYLIVPLSAASMIAASFNMKLSRETISKPVLFFSLFLLCWIAFVGWTLPARFIDSQNDGASTQDYRSSQPESGLKIKTLNLP